jgi:hypothetical protein
MSQLSRQVTLLISLSPQQESKVKTFFLPFYLLPLAAAPSRFLITFPFGRYSSQEDSSAAACGKLHVLNCGKATYCDSISCS